MKLANASLLNIAKMGRGGIQCVATGNDLLPDEGPALSMVRVLHTYSATCPDEELMRLGSLAWMAGAHDPQTFTRRHIGQAITVTAQIILDTKKEREELVELIARQVASGSAGRTCGLRLARLMKPYPVSKFEMQETGFSLGMWVQQTERWDAGVMGLHALLTQKGDTEWTAATSPTTKVA